MKKPSFLKKHWDIISAYNIFITSILLAWILFQSCHDWECLGGFVYPFIGYIIGIILILISVYRQTRKHLNNLRWLFVSIYFIPGLWLIGKLLKLY